MEETNSLWTIGSLAFIAGIIGGALLYRLLKGSSPQQSRLEDQLRQAEEQLKGYQDQVADHFSTTAHLVNKLTESYKDVNEHLASGSQSLCNDEVTRQRLNDSLLISNTLISNTDDATSAQPPLDYSNSKGTLSEEFSALKNNFESTQKLDSEKS